MTAFDPQDIPIANSYSRDDFGTPEEVRGWNLCRDHVIAMVAGVQCSCGKPFPEDGGAEGVCECCSGCAP